MNIFEKEFDFVIQRAKSLDRPPRMVVAGADCENILKAVFEAQNQGFCRPILVGSEEKISAMLKKLGLYDREYVISAVSDSSQIKSFLINGIWIFYPFRHFGFCLNFFSGR